MSSIITAVAQWVKALTIDASEPPNSANWLPILKSHADRQAAAAACLAETWTKSDSSNTSVLYSAFVDKFHGLAFAIGWDRAVRFRVSDLGQQTQTLFAGAQITGGCASPGGIVVLADYTGGVHESSDGLSFTARATGSDTMRSVIWTGENFVAVGLGTSSVPVYTSTDGQTWTSRANAAGGGWTIATNGSGTVISVYPGPFMMRSLDHGVTWSAVTPPTYGWSSLTYMRSTDTWYLIDGAGNDYYSNDGGDTWTAWSWSIAYSGAGARTLKSVAATESVLLALTDDPAASGNFDIISSRDGTNFSVAGVATSAFTPAEYSVTTMNDAPIAIVCDTVRSGSGPTNLEITAPIWTG